MSATEHVDRRRTLQLVAGLLVIVAGVVGLSASPAAAHSCAKTVTVVQGQNTDVTVSATTGDDAATEVLFVFDKSFEITKDVKKAGWKVEQTTSKIRFSGGHLDSNTCAPFDIPIRANESGTYRVSAFMLQADGQQVQHPQDGDVIIQPNGASVVVDHEGPPNELFEQVIEVTPSDKASSSRTGLLIVTALALVIGAGAFALRRRR